MKTSSRWIILVAALLLIPALFVPLWQILLWAPQYPEWLSMKIWIDNITGDVRTINALNHYVGMKQINLSMFPEFAYMKYIVMGMAAFGILTALLKSIWSLRIYFFLFVVAATAALYDYYQWSYKYGHELDPTAPIQVPGMVYQPPLLGTKQLLNFTAYSGPDIGSWFFIVSGVLVFVVLIIETRRNLKAKAK